MDCIEGLVLVVYGGVFFARCMRVGLAFLKFVDCKGEKRVDF